MELIRLGESVHSALEAHAAVRATVGSTGVKSGAEAALLQRVQAAHTPAVFRAAEKEEELFLFPNNEAGWLATVRSSAPYASISLHEGPVCDQKPTGFDFCSLPVSCSSTAGCKPCAAVLLEPHGPAHV